MLCKLRVRVNGLYIFIMTWPPSPQGAMCLTRSAIGRTIMCIVGLKVTVNILSCQ